MTKIEENLEQSQLNLTSHGFKTEGVEFIKQQLNILLKDVAETVSEYKAEAGVWLREAGVEEKLFEAKGYLQAYADGTEFGEIATAAIEGLEVGIAWLNSEQDLRLFDVVTELVGFGLCVVDYLKNGHHLGDLEIVAGSVIKLIETEIFEAKTPVLPKPGNI